MSNDSCHVLFIVNTINCQFILISYCSMFLLTFYTFPHEYLKKFRIWRFLFRICCFLNTRQIAKNMVTFTLFEFSKDYSNATAVSNWQWWNVMGKRGWCNISIHIIFVIILKVRDFPLFIFTSIWDWGYPVVGVSKIFI